MNSLMSSGTPSSTSVLFAVPLGHEASIVGDEVGVVVKGAGVVVVGPVVGEVVAPLPPRYRYNSSGTSAIRTVIPVCHQVSSAGKNKLNIKNSALGCAKIPEERVFLCIWDYRRGCIVVETCLRYCCPNFVFAGGNFGFEDRSFGRMALSLEPHCSGSKIPEIPVGTCAEIPVWICAQPFPCHLQQALCQRICYLPVYREVTINYPLPAAGMGLYEGDT